MNTGITGDEFGQFLLIGGRQKLKCCILDSTSVDAPIILDLLHRDCTLSSAGLSASVDALERLFPALISLSSSCFLLQITNGPMLIPNLLS